MTTNAGGRPRSYTQADLELAVKQVEDAQQPVNATSIAKAMSLISNISKGINAISLQKAIDDFLEDREVERNQARIDRLPDSIKSQNNDLGILIVKHLNQISGHTYEKLEETAYEKVRQVEAEKAAMLAHIRELQTKILIDDKAITDLKAENERIAAHLSVSASRIKELEDEIKITERSRVNEAEILKNNSQAVADQLALYRKDEEQKT